MIMERGLLVRDFEKSNETELLVHWLVLTLVFFVFSLFSFLHCMEAMSPVIHVKH